LLVVLEVLLISNLGPMVTRRTLVPGTNIRGSSIHSHVALLRKLGGEICEVSMK
jgi:hypothetical protein